jgi:hypothetical protein
MLTSRLTLMAVLGCLAALFVAGPASAATTPAAKPLTQTVAMTGKAKNGKAFTGTFTIDRFKSVGGKTYAVGTLKGKLDSRKITRDNVSVPAKLAGAPGGARAAQIPTTCQVLSLVLGPLDLNLLGLRVQLNQVNLLITAVPGAGNLLGNLLCSVTNLLNPGALPIGAQLSAILNAILALIPAA